MHGVRRAFPSRRTRSMSPPRLRRADGGNRKLLGCGVLGRQLNRQPMPPFLPTTAQNFTSPTRFHTSTEAMRADTTLVARTICWLAHSNLPKTSGVIAKRRQAMSLAIACQRVSYCLLSREIDFSTRCVYVRSPRFSTPLWIFPRQKLGSVFLTTSSGTFRNKRFERGWNLLWELNLRTTD